MSDLSISTVRSQLIVKHYKLLNGRDSWYNPDQDNLEEINRDITRFANFIDALDEIIAFTLDQGE